MGITLWQSMSNNTKEMIDNAFCDIILYSIFWRKIKMLISKRCFIRDTLKEKPII